MNRKQRRAMKKELKKQHGVEDEMAEKMMMFDHLPDEFHAFLPRVFLLYLHAHISYRNSRRFGD